MRSGGLFAGYGGLDMAVAEVFGAEPAWFSEIDEAPSKILAHHWPEIPNHGDITQIDWDVVEPVDILTGGFPCQDVSAAGKRAGLRPGTRSGLWNHMAYAISKLRPRYVVAENVRGLLSAEAHSDVEPCPWCLGDGPGEPALRALGAVLGDLAELGYDTQWCGLHAADVGAPHGRFRVFVVARDTQSSGWDAARPAIERWQPTWPAGGSGFAPADAACERYGDAGQASLGGVSTAAVTGAAPHAQGYRRNQGWPESAGELGGPDAPERSAGATSWGEYADAVGRWERILGRVAPTPVVLADAYVTMLNRRLAQLDRRPVGRRGSLRPQRRLSPQFVEWMMGLPAGHVTAVPGVNRNAQLKALGNGVVPLQAIAALRHMLSVREEAA